MVIRPFVFCVAAAGQLFAVSACMTFVAGKKVSSTGHVIVGHNEDDFPPLTVHHGMVPARDWPAGTVLPATRGRCATIPQAAHTLACYWSEVKFPKGKPFPFSVKPTKARFSVADMEALLSAHNAPLKNGRHVRETWSICAETTIESSVCEFIGSPRETILHVALGHGCEKPYLRLRPFAEPLPAEIDESATAEARLSRHVYLAQ